MVHLEVSHINLLTKIDLCPFKEHLERFLYPDGRSIVDELTYNMGSQYRSLNNAVGALLNDYSMVSFVSLDITNYESITRILLQVDTALHYGEDEEVRCRNIDKKF